MQMKLSGLGGNRSEWEFEYTARVLAKAAADQRDFRLGRVLWWKNAKDKVMAEVLESGLEVNEGMGGAAQGSNYATQVAAPHISVRNDLQQKLSECHAKVQKHDQAAAEYDGWVQVLEANPEQRLKLTHQDWLYFFGKQ